MPPTVDPEIAPPAEVRDVSLPPALGETLQGTFDADAPPETVGEWLTAMESALADSVDGAPSIDDLCTVEDGRHAFESVDGDVQRYVCVLDPLGYPFLTDTPGTVRSETPVREETLSVTVSEEGVETTHSEAVVSLGVSETADQVETVTPEVLYSEGCPYIHAFVDEAEYEVWAKRTDGVTTAVPLETGVGIAALIAEELFGGTA